MSSHVEKQQDSNVRLNTNITKKEQKTQSQGLRSASAAQQTANKSSYVSQLQAMQQMANSSPYVTQHNAIQRKANNSSASQKHTQLQAYADKHTNNQYPIKQRENNTGLPNNLKARVENLSGYSMDDVKVHYNSDKPAQLQADAYAQGTDIHVGPGQEKHLPHEAWHVVQQKQGRVSPTMPMKKNGDENGDENDDGLEKEADEMSNQMSQNAEISTLEEQTEQETIDGDANRSTIDEFLTWFEGSKPEKDDDKEFNIKQFIEFQKRLINNEEDITTMGPEFEFAKVNPGGLEPLPIHEELLKSAEQINDLPFVFETDAGNVIEAAFPPFIIGKKNEDFDVKVCRAMRITSHIEKHLKSLGENIAQNNGNLSDLKAEIEKDFGINLQPQSKYTKDNYADMKVLRFTKGIGLFSNEFITSDEVTNAQINITMGLDVLDSLLKGATTTNRGQDHMKRKVATTQWLQNKLNPEDKHVDILAYYISQIPMMALQNLMVKSRSVNSGRVDFKKDTVNATLLSKLSSIKDFMGFWVKAGLNDMIKVDNGINNLLKRIEKKQLTEFLLEDDSFKDLSKTYMPSLVNFDNGSGNVKTESYKQMVNSIIDGMYNMSENIQDSEDTKAVDIMPDKAKSQDENSYTKYLKGADDKNHAAPFMTRPDTHVSIPKDQFLVEVRGLNKGVLSNDSLHKFYMPGFRKSNDWQNDTFVNYDDLSKNKIKEQGGAKTFKSAENDITLKYTTSDGITIHYENSEEADKRYPRDIMQQLDPDKVIILNENDQLFEALTVQLGKEGETIRIKKNQVDRFMLSFKTYIRAALRNRAYDALGDRDSKYKVLCTSNILRIEVLRKKENRWKLRLHKKEIDRSYVEKIKKESADGKTKFYFPNNNQTIELESNSDAIDFEKFIEDRLAPPQDEITEEIKESDKNSIKYFTSPLEFNETEEEIDNIDENSIEDFSSIEEES